MLTQARAGIRVSMCTRLAGPLPYDRGSVNNNFRHEGPQFLCAGPAREGFATVGWS